MDNSIYIATSQQQILFRDMEVTANNIANINTPGFQGEKLQFSQYLMPDGAAKNAYANNPKTYRDTTPGPISYTNNPFDLAINGHAYFQVQTPLGTRYTRSGNFQINDQGVMVSADGYPVLGSDGGEITIPQGTKEVVINGAGQVTVDGESAGQVGIMEFQNEQRLVRLGNSLYTSSDTPQQAETARVVQGAVEGSNVQGVTELVRVMNLSRSVANSSKFIETMYDLERKASDTYTRAASA